MQSELAESDLYAPVKIYLEHLGYEVRGEVQGCDLVAIRSDELVVVELKLGVTMPLLVQAVDRQRTADVVYVAIPHPKQNMCGKRWQGIVRLLNRLSLGLITVRKSRGRLMAEVAFHPAAPEPRKLHRQRASILREAAARSGDYNIGGSHNRKIATVYRESAIHIACCLERYGPLPPRVLRTLGTGAKTQAILSANHYEWFIRVERGVYGLTDRGSKELDDFPELAEFYRQSVKKGAAPEGYERLV